jgi:hypothetical protein
MNATDETMVKADRRRRLRYTTEQKTALVEAYQSSGLSGPRFAELHGDNYQTCRPGSENAIRPRARSRTPNPPLALYRRCALSWKLGAALVGRILAELGLSVPRGRAFAHVGESDRGFEVAAGDAGSTALTSRAPGEEIPAQIITGAPFSTQPSRRMG